MSITLSELRRLETIPKLIFHSLDLALYQVSACIDGEEHLIMTAGGRPLRAHNLLSLQAQFENLPVADQVLRHQSAYDEMINQPGRAGSNQLEVLLGNNRLG